MLGRHLESEEGFEQAIAAYQRAAELDPTASEVPAELAALYQRQGRLKDATVSAQAALKIDPGNVTAHRVLGIIFATMAGSDDGDPKTAATVDNAVRQAIEHLEKAHRADGTDRDVGLDLALSRLYMHAGENQKAADLLNRVLEYEPDAAEAYVLLSRAEQRSRKRPTETRRCWPRLPSCTRASASGSRPRTRTNSSPSSTRPAPTSRRSGRRRCCRPTIRRAPLARAICCRR
jgi:tetratricopeptide (TPR) repeat protein